MEQLLQLRELDEAGLRDMESLWPRTVEELADVARALTERKHDYGTCVYAMSHSALAALNFVAHQQGCTGFQVSCADLDIVLVQVEDALFPQKDILSEVAQWIAKSKSWLQEQAVSKMSEFPGEPDSNGHRFSPSGMGVHPDVWARWEKLSRGELPPSPQERETSLCNALTRLIEVLEIHGVCYGLTQDESDKLASAKNLVKPLDQREASNVPR